MAETTCAVDLYSKTMYGAPMMVPYVNQLSPVMNYTVDKYMFRILAQNPNVVMRDHADGSIITMKDIEKYFPSGGGGSSAADVSYDNSTSGMTATDVQTAIDELSGRMQTLTEDEYEALTPEEKNNGTYYFTHE